ncbi:MAG TPA: hypothetical protein VIH99_05310 [Bdellovibrionota bacterium]|jgi:hypothetical protein
MKKTTKRSNSRTKSTKAKTAGKSKAKPKAKAKTAGKSRLKAHSKPAKKSRGLSITELFQMKQQQQQSAQAQANDPEAWKHKKELPPQDQHHPEDAKDIGGGKKSGFGGVRHH